ncbi:hypothetical protein STFR1_60002 [Bacillus vallismortis]
MTCSFLVNWTEKIIHHYSSNAIVQFFYLYLIQFYGYNEIPFILNTLNYYKQFHYKSPYVNSSSIENMKKIPLGLCYS